MRPKSNAKEHQDLFVLCMLQRKKRGTYVEIGGSHPIRGNSTFLLESCFDWRGVSVEWDKRFADSWQICRVNSCIFEDATNLDYEEIFNRLSFGETIDFMQLDIDPHINTFNVLRLIDFNKRRFCVLTYEHDFYKGGRAVRDESRRILLGHGYKLVVADVMTKGSSFEDWYVHSEIVAESVWRPFLGSCINMNPQDILNAYKTLLHTPLSIKLI
jgi:hypothetical protein